MWRGCGRAVEGLALRVCPEGEDNGSCRRRGGCRRGRAAAGGASRSRTGIRCRAAGSWPPGRSRGGLSHPSSSSSRIGSYVITYDLMQLEDDDAARTSHLDQPEPAQEEPEAEEWLKRSSWGGGIRHAEDWMGGR